MPEILDRADAPPAGVGDPDDVLRSLRRYVSLMLGSPPWKVRLQRVRVSDDQRPVAVIEAGVLTTLFARTRTLNQGDVQKMQPFTIVCYPEVQATAVASAALARQIANVLDAGFSRGLVTDDVPAVLIGAPWTVPVYSFQGVPLEGPTRVGAATPYMYANVDQTFSVRPVQDAMDELRYTVVATLRATWWQGGRVPPSSPLAVDIHGTFEGDGG